MNNVIWQKNGNPQVELGGELQCWAVVKRVSTYDGKTRVNVRMLNFLNRPVIDEDDDAGCWPDWAMSTDDGDWMHAVGWHNVHDHPDFSCYYQPLDSESTVLAWAPIKYPALPECYLMMQEQKA